MLGDHSELGGLDRKGIMPLIAARQPAPIRRCRVIVRVIGQVFAGHRIALRETAQVVVDHNKAETRRGNLGAHRRHVDGLPATPDSFPSIPTSARVVGGLEIRSVEEPIFAGLPAGASPTVAFCSARISPNWQCQCGTGRGLAATGALLPGAEEVVSGDAAPFLHRERRKLGKTLISLELSGSD